MLDDYLSLFSSFLKVSFCCSFVNFSNSLMVVLPNFGILSASSIVGIGLTVSLSPSSV